MWVTFVKDGKTSRTDICYYTSGRSAMQTLSSLVCSMQSLCLVAIKCKVVALKLCDEFLFLINRCIVHKIILNARLHLKL